MSSLFCFSRYQIVSTDMTSQILHHFCPKLFVFEEWIGLFFAQANVKDLFEIPLKQDKEREQLG